jgi:hypothetical protein
MNLKSQIKTILNFRTHPKIKIDETQFPTGFITSNFIIETSSLQDKHLFNYFRENDIS